MRKLPIGNLTNSTTSGLSRCMSTMWRANLLCSFWQYGQQFFFGPSSDVRIFILYLSHEPVFIDKLCGVGTVLSIWLTFTPQSTLAESNLICKWKHWLRVVLNYHQQGAHVIAMTHLPAYVKMWPLSVYRLHIPILRTS